MGLMKIGQLWPPKPGGSSKTIASGYLQTPGKRVRIFVFPAKQGTGFVLMADDGEERKDQPQGQGGGGWGGGNAASTPQQNQGGGGWGGGGGDSEPDGGDVPF